MSANTEPEGYVAFETGDGTALRCQLGSSGCIEFGPAADLSELAGPVEYLKFTCYDGNDPAVRTDVAEHVRLVTWEARLDSSGTLTEDKVVSGACCLRVNGNTGSEDIDAMYDFATGRQGVDCFAFAGADKPRVPRAPDTPSSPLTTGQYDAIEVQDGILHEVNATAESDYLLIRLVFQIEEDESDVTGITATWRGKGVNEHPSRMDGASLYLWNYAIADYELLQASPDTEAEITLSGSRTDTPGRYVGGVGDDMVVLVAVSNDKKTGQKANTLFTDYVRLDVAASQSPGVLP